MPAEVTWKTWPLANVPVMARMSVSSPSHVGGREGEKGEGGAEGWRGRGRGWGGVRNKRGGGRKIIQKGGVNGGQMKET